MRCSPLVVEDLRAALRDTYEPACFILDASMRRSLSRSLLESHNDTLLGVSVVERGSKFYAVVPDGGSLIGFRRERPAMLHSVPWQTLRALFAHFAEAQRQLASPLPLPPPLSDAVFPAGSGVGRRQSSGESPRPASTRVRLSTVVKRGFTMYVNGNTRAFDSHNSLLRRTLMEAVDGWMTAADVGTAAGVRPWLSAGGTESGLHFDYSDNIHCSLAGGKNVSLFAPSETAHLYPVEFSSRRVPDVALDLDAEGELRARMVGDAEREDLMYSAVDEAAVDTSIFPRFALAKKIEHVQRAGECLLIPAYWWHNVRDADADSATAPSAHAS